jgi:hypothetical protein
MCKGKWGTNECIPYESNYKTSNMISLNGIRRTAKQISYMWTYGTIQENKRLFNLCKNRKCINGKHLYYSSKKLKNKIKAMKRKHKMKECAKNIKIEKFN